MVVKRQRRHPRLGLTPDMAPPSPLAEPVSIQSVRSPATAPQRRRAYPERKETSNPDSSVVGGLYIISVAARLLEMHPQTLRKYERVGLISPPRTEGMLRLYSSQDITRLRLIKYLVEELGINLAGVEFVLDMFARLHQVRDRVTALEEAQPLKDMMAEEPETLLELLNKAFDGLLER